MDNPAGTTRRTALRQAGALAAAVAALEAAGPLAFVPQRALAATAPCAWTGPASTPWTCPAAERVRREPAGQRA
jgi:hypothetical protein